MREDTAAEIASLSGGEHLRFDEKHDLDDKLGTLANHIAGRCTLSFRPSAETAGFHELRARVVHHPEVSTVAARTSYLSENGPDPK